MRNNFVDSSSPTNQGTSEKELLGGNKSNHTNLYMDDNDDISLPRGASSTKSNVVAESKNDVFSIEPRRPISKLPTDNDSEESLKGN